MKDETKPAKPRKKPRKKKAGKPKRDRFVERLLACRSEAAAVSCIRRHQRQLANAERQLYWGGDAKRVKVSEVDLKARLDECRATMVESTGSKTMKRDWPLGSYRMSVTGTRAQLYVRGFDGSLTVWYCNSKSAGTSEKDDAVGSKARKIACRDIRKATGRSVNSFYGYGSIAIKNCIPRQFYYLDPTVNGRILDNMNAIDACSQYPSGFMGDMPTATGCMTVQGTVGPTAEYPFAFYIKSGHMAIYNELDTHSWMESPFADNLCPLVEPSDAYRESPSIHHDYLLDPEKDVTVLMKKAEHNPFRDFFLKWYGIKETYPHDSKEYKDSKLVMNALIGMMHQKDFTYRKTSFRLSHLAAVAIARGNQRLLDKALEIGVDNIAMMVVDSIIYRGSREYGGHEKALGTFHQEVTGCRYRQLKNSVYVFMDGDGKCVKYKHGAYNRNMDGTPISEPSSFMDMDDWTRVLEGDTQDGKE